MDDIVWRWKHFGGWLAGAIGAILAWFAGFELLEKLTRDVAPEALVAEIYLGLLALAVFVFCTYRIWMTIRKERYANITRQMHSILHELRDVQTYIKTKEPRGDGRAAYDLFLSNCRMMFSNALDHLNTAFTSLTSTTCRSAIKLTYERNGKLYVYTLTRDRSAQKDCKSLDNKRVDQDHDPLEKNYQFAKLADSKQEYWHFSSNNLMKEKSFLTTSPSAYDDNWASDLNTNGRKRWPLPYRSTVTCVIRQARFDFAEDQESEVLGFLAVDSQSRGVFDSRWDVELLFAVADALYAPIQAYLEVQARVPIADAGGKPALPAPV